MTSWLSSSPAGHVQGAVPGSKKRVITLRRSIFPQTSRNALEEVRQVCLADDALLSAHCARLNDRHRFDAAAVCPA